MATAYTNSCVCGESFKGVNCAHYLSNWLIQNGRMDANLAGCYCCKSGRPIRAKEVRENYFVKNFDKVSNDPGKNCFVYSEKPGQGHVYFGTKTECVAGVGVMPGATYFEFYVEK